MSFSQVLRDITDEVKGSIGAAVVGMDGIIVEEHLKDPGYDLQGMGAEYGNILKEVQQAAGSLKMGGARELAVMAESCELLIRRINDEYFLALLMAPNSNLGRGRFAARMAANRVEKEF